MSHNTNKNLDHFLKKIPLFSDLTVTQLSKLATGTRFCHYQKHDLVFSEGEIKAVLYIVFTGKVKLFKLSAQGKEQIIHVYGANHLFAEASIFEEKSMPVNCATLEETTLCELSKKALLTLIRSHPNVSLKLLAMQAKRLRLLTKKIESLSLHDANQRLIRYLLAQVNNEQMQASFILNVSRGTLALILGISRENLSRLLKKLQMQKLIQIKHRQCALLDIKRLKQRLK